MLTEKIKTENIANLHLLYLIKFIQNYAVQSNNDYTIVGIIGNNNISSEKFILDFKNKVIKK